MHQKNIDIVNITKLKAAYEFRFNYLKILSEFIKTLPKEHRRTKVQGIIDSDGVEKTEWVRIINEVELGKVITFMLDNSIPFHFNNITSDVVNRLKNEYKERVNRISKILKLKAETLDISDENFDFLKKAPYDYQKQAYKFFEINNGKAILGDQPGVGKTLPPIVYATKNKLRTLVICPASLKLNWRNEIMSFTNEKAFIFKYKPKNIKKDTNFTKEESLFHIINYDILESYIKLEYKHKCSSGMMIQHNGKNKKCSWEEIDLNKSYKDCPICHNTTIKSKVCGVVYIGDKEGTRLDPEDYDLVIIDECHRMKDIKTTWTQLIKKGLDDIPRKILLSGTLIKNRPFELFQLLNYLDPKEWNNSHEFAVRYCAAYQDKFGWVYSGASNLEELFERLSPYFLRRLKKDVLKSLPPKTYTVIPIELSDQEYKEYKKLEKEKKKGSNGEDVEQLYLEKIHKLKMFTGRIKLKRSIEIIKDIIESGEKVVVVSDYIELAKGICDYFPDISVLHTGGLDMEEKEESVQKFQKNKNIKIFSGMIIASGVGITLTAASKLIKIGFGWSPSDEEQVEDRIHRANTTSDNIDILRLVCKDTIDEDINELLDEKSKVVSKVLDNKQFKKEINVSDENIFKQLIERMKEK